MKLMKVYGIKNNVKEVVFNSIEINALVNGGVKTAKEQGYVITEIIELPLYHNNFVESPLTFRATQKLLERSI